MHRICSETDSCFFWQLKLALLHLFVESQSELDAIKLEEYEKKILKAILLRKNLRVPEDDPPDAHNLDRIARSLPLKKRESNFKFVFPKCFKFLKKQFWRTLGTNTGDGRPGPAETLQDKEYAFFAHYFGEASREKAIPIEKFFLFRNWTHRFNEHIPKTITMDSIRLWKQNPRFIGAMREYLNREFMDEVREMNRAKIRFMMRKWSRIALREGIHAAENQILASMGLKGTKLPWTVQEVQIALEETLAIIS